MGWKLAVVISKLDGRELGALVDEIYGAPQILTPSDISTDRALYPDDKKARYALAHEGFGWIFDWELIERALAEALPVKAPLSTFVLHSVVNWYGFAEQRDGAFVRCRSGSSDSGIDFDEGIASATERALVAAHGKPGQEALAWATWCDGEKSFDGVYEDTRHDVMGEDVVFGLIGELVGFRIDKDLPAVEAFINTRVMTIERPKGKSMFSRLLR